MPDVRMPQAPTPGAPAKTDLMAFWPPAPSTDPPVTRTVKDAVTRPSDFLAKATDLWFPILTEHGSWAQAAHAKGSVSYYTGAPGADTILSTTVVNPPGVDASTITHIRMSKFAYGDANYIESIPNAAVAEPSGTLFHHPDQPYLKTPVGTFVVGTVTSGGSGDTAYWEFDVTGVGAGFWGGDSAFIRSTDSAPGNQLIDGEQVKINDGFLARLRRLGSFATAHVSSLSTFLGIASAGRTTLIAAFADFFIERTDFEAKATDRWANYSEDFQYWGQARSASLGQIAFFTGAPAAATLVVWDSYSTGKDLTGVTRIRVNKTLVGTDNYFANADAAYPGPQSGDVLYLHGDSPYRASPYAIFTLSADAASGGGSGIPEYWDLTGTMQQGGGNFIPGGEGFLRLTDEAPGGVIVPGNRVGLDLQFGSRIVRLFESMTGVWLKRLRKIIQGNNETETLRVTRVGNTPSNPGEIYILHPQNGQALLYPPAATKAGTPFSVADLREFKAGDFLTWGSVEWEIGDTPWNTFSGNVLQANVVLADGYTYDAADVPALNAAADLVLEGRDIHLGLVIPAILKRVGINIGGKGGTEGDYWNRSTGDENAGWKTPRATVRATGMDKTLVTEIAARALADEVESKVPSLEAPATYSAYACETDSADVGTGEIYWSGTEVTMRAKAADVEGWKVRLRRGTQVTVTKDATNYATFEVLQGAFDGADEWTLSTVAAVSVTGAIADGDAVSIELATPGLAAPEGIRRINTTALSWTGSTTEWSSVMTVALANVPANAQLRVRGRVYLARGQGNQNLLGVILRRKFGTNSYAALIGAGDYNRLSQKQFALDNAWLDGVIEAVDVDTIFDGPTAAQTVKVNVAAAALGQSSSLTLEAENLYLNRVQQAWGNAWPGTEGPYISWLELSYEKAGGKIATETTTTRDAT